MAPHELCADCLPHSLMPYQGSQTLYMELRGPCIHVPTKEAEEAALPSVTSLRNPRHLTPLSSPAAITKPTQIQRGRPHIMMGRVSKNFEVTYEGT